MVGRLGCERHRRLLAGFLGDAQRAILGQPVARDDKAGERLRELGHQRLPDMRRQVLELEQGLADRREMAEAFDDAFDREDRKVGIVVLDQRQAGLGRADLGNRRRDRARQVRAARDCRLHGAGAGRDMIDKIGVEQKRRAFEHDAGDLAVVGGERMDDGGRRQFAVGQRFGQRMAHQGRRIVEQHDHGALAGGAIVLAHVRIKVGPRQGRCRIGALGGRSGAHPLKKLTYDHCICTRAARTSAARSRGQAKPGGLIKGSP